MSAVQEQLPRGSRWQPSVRGEDMQPYQVEYIANLKDIAVLAARKKTSHSKYVIAMGNHKPLSKSSYRSMWKLIERELPDTHVTAHILRHTYITRLFEAGLDIKEIQYLAGHSTVDMTLRVYTHYDRLSRNAKTAEKVREALRTA